MRRFFIPSGNINNGNAIITGSDVHHILDVLRKGVGDTIQATDGLGNILTARITGIKQPQINLEIIETKHQEERKTFIKLFQAIPKGGKFEWIVEKSCELGVNEIVPVITERTIPKYNNERGLKKLAHWERIALESMKQIGRNTPMSIHKTIIFKDVQRILKPFSKKIVLWELEETEELKTFLRENNSAAEFEIFIGPEGGFSIQEIDDLKNLGFITVSLGKRILKAETAAIIAIGNIYFEMEN